MSNVAKAFRAEIIRLSGKEVKAAVNPLKKSNFALKKSVWELNRKVATLESETKRLLASRTEPQVPKEKIAKARITSKNVRALRTKLGLSQDSFAKLLGVSGQAVYSIEHKEGRRLKLRPATMSHLLLVREMGKREAKKSLEEIDGRR
jgi:DNA-binding transcriptional regulator YiaG